MLGVLVWDFKGKEGTSHEDRKACVCYLNVRLAKQRQWEAEMNFRKQTLLGSSLSPCLLYTILVYGDSSIPGTGSLSTFSFLLIHTTSFVNYLLLKLGTGKIYEAKIDNIEKRNTILQ